MKQGIECFLDHFDKVISSEIQESIYEELEHLKDNQQPYFIYPSKLIKYMYLTGLELVKRRSLKEAASLFNLLFLLFPNVYEICLGLAITYHEQTQFEKALLLYKKAQELCPDRPLSWDLYSRMLSGT